MSEFLKIQAEFKIKLFEEWRKRSDFLEHVCLTLVEF